jgi:signal transduction histidine kinase/PAS domain-containing protein
MTDRKIANPAALLRELVDRARTIRSGSQDSDHVLTEELGALDELRFTEEELRLQSEALEEALGQVHRERQRFEELFRHAPIAYLLTDMEGVITDANAAASSLLNLPTSGLVGEPLAAFSQASDELRSQLERLARFESLDDWESELRAEGGTLVPVRISATTAQARSTGDVEVRWVLRDGRPERESRQRERRLQREQMARAALEQIAKRARFLSEASAKLLGVLEQDAVWQIAAELAAVNAEGVVLLERWDTKPDRLTVRSTAGSGEVWSRLDGLRGTVVDLGASEASDPVLPPDLLRRVLDGGEPEVDAPSGEEPAPHAGLVVVPIIVQQRTAGLMALWVPTGRRLGEEVLLNRTLAERVGLALDAATLFEEVVRARRRAEEATAAESDFLAMVSHELRTPLTAIISYSELLQDRSDELPPRLARYAQQIAGAAQHQRELVEQILSYKQVAREDAGAAEPEELDYRDVAQFAVAMVRPQAEGKPVEVTAVLPPVPVPGICDPGKLRQILANLLSNAIRHTDEGYVRLTLSADEPYVVLTVEDTGEGIPAEDLPRIFDRFWRGRSTGATPRGSGLGLTITRELVSRMGGEIRVESDPRTGTTFIVRILRVTSPRRAQG